MNSLIRLTPFKWKRATILFLTLNLVTGCTSTPSLFSSSDQEENEQAQTLYQRRLHQQADAFNTPVWKIPLLGCTGQNPVAVLLKLDPIDILSTLSEPVDAASPDCSITAIAESYVANRQQEYTDSRQVLDSIIADISRKNQQLNDLIDTMQVVVAENERKVTALNKQYEQGSITVDILFRELALVKVDRDRIARVLLSAMNQLYFFQDAKADYEKNNPDIDTAKLDDEISRFQEKTRMIKMLWYRAG